MAGDWIKVECVTPDKPEVFQLAEILNIDPDAVTGKLIRVWIWADQQTIDGNAKGVTRMLLDRITGVTGFANAMLQTCWLEEINGSLAFSGFDKHNGQGAKKRAESNRRVSKHREKLKQECNADSVTKSVTREEKRREEKSNNKKENIKKKKSVSRATKLKDDFLLTDHRLNLANTYWIERDRPDLAARTQEIFDAFTNHAKANGKSYVDWDAAWTTWYTNAVKFERKPHENGSSGIRKPSRDEQIEQAAEEYLRGSKGIHGGNLEGTDAIEISSPDARVSGVQDLGKELQ